MDQLASHKEQILALIGAAWQGQTRLILGLAGPPGAGKSTLAEAVVAALNARQPGQAAVLPMDGFHLDNATLDRLGLRAVKGAPQTFDAAGFKALLGQVRAGGPLRYPLFDRAADCSLPDAGRLAPETRIILAEGNYLLSDDAAWAGIRTLFDLTILLAPPIEVLEERLIQRWLNHGLPGDQARARALGNDLPNARFVQRTSTGADLVLTI